MKIKISQKYGGLFLAVLFLTLVSPADAATPAKKNKLNKLTSQLTEEKYAAPATIFGGVGRKIPTWQAGIDLIILSSPHYGAFRNRLELSNRVYWGEWWYSDSWGFKGLFSEQTFKMFGTSGNRPQSKTSHLGLLAKTQHSLADSWKISAAMGLAKTEFVMGNQSKLGNSLVSEFRMGMEILADLWTEAGILTIDSASGSGSTDQRIGSTAYLIGLSYGF